MAKSFEEIYEEFSAEYSDATGLRLQSGSDMDIRLRALAAQLQSLWVQADWVMRQCFPQTADGAQLDRHARLRGLERGAALKASGSISFSIPEALEEDIDIAAGVICSTSSGAEFITLEAAAIPAGELSVSVPAEAREAGGFGNVAADSIVYMAEPPVGVTGCTNPAAFSGGADTEDDESLRVRVMETYSALPNGTNAAYYKKLVAELDGVAAVNVHPKARGLGTVDITFSTADGVPSAAKIAEAETLLNRERELCVDIAVSAPAAVSVSPAVAIKVKEGYDYSEVSQAVSDAIAAYFDGSLLGCDVLLAKLGQLIYGVEGVYNYSISSPRDDVAIGSDELAVLGTLTISEMGA